MCKLIIYNNELNVFGNIDAAEHAACDPGTPNFSLRQSNL